MWLAVLLVTVLVVADTALGACPARCRAAIAACVTTQQAARGERGWSPRAIRHATGRFRQRCRRTIVHGCRVDPTRCDPPLDSVSTTTTTIVASDQLTTTTRGRGLVTTTTTAHVGTTTTTLINFTGTWLFDGTAVSWSSADCRYEAGVLGFFRLVHGGTTLFGDFGSANYPGHGVVLGGNFFRFDLDTPICRDIPIQPLGSVTCCKRLRLEGYNFTDADHGMGAFYRWDDCSPIVVNPPFPPQCFVLYTGTVARQ